MRPENRPLDLLIVGGGPAGLSAAYAARECGLSYLVLERGGAVQTIRDYPLGKPLHSPAQDVEMLWGELHASDPRFAGREETLAHYDAFAAGLALRCGESVLSLERCPAGFRARTALACYEASRVLLATGGFGVPRRLGVPGECEGRVSYRFHDARAHAGEEIVVIGGGNSAAEAALWLHEAGARVTLSLRRPSFAPRCGTHDEFTSVKTYNIERLKALARSGQIAVLFSSEATCVSAQAVHFRVPEGSLAVPCRHAFALLGADPDVSLLRGVGADIAADGRPVYHPETFETTVRGLHVAGHLTRALHLRRAIDVPRRVVRQIAGERFSARGAGSLQRLVLTGANAARRRLRALAALRRLIQRVVWQEAMREVRPSLAHRVLRQFPPLHRMARRVRAFAAP
jgi:thioredoxin reductase (NADPH)